MSCDDCVRLWRLSQAVGRRWLMVTILLRDLVGVQQLAQPQVGPHAPMRLESGGLVPISRVVNATTRRSVCRSSARHPMRLPRLTLAARL